MDKPVDNSAPGWKQYPDHRITIKRAGGRAQVTLDGDVIADTTDAIALEEPHVGHTVAPLVYYFPRKDVKMERLVRSTHETHCPFKGRASHYSFVNGPHNAVWSYEHPYDEMLALKERLAFYPDKVDSIRILG